MFITAQVLAVRLQGLEQGHGHDKRRGFYLLFSHLQGFGATTHYCASYVHYLFPGSTRIKLKQI